MDVYHIDGVEVRQKGVPKYDSVYKKYKHRQNSFILKRSESCFSWELCQEGGTGNFYTLVTLYVLF